MASPLNPPSLISSSPLSPLRRSLFSPPKTLRPQLLLNQAQIRKRLRHFVVVNFHFNETPAVPALKLLSIVSGLNRGLAASEEDLKRAEAAAKELEEIGGVVDLNTNLEKLQGRWKLIYSSAFSSRTLGGSRPGPPVGRLVPISLGQVFQRIDILSKDFDNIVELQIGTPWPIPPAEATATLAHKFEVIGTSSIKITFEKTTVKTTGNLSQLPPLDIPKLPEQLRPASNTGSGEFEVTYLDSDLRITRGDRSELRVFVIS